MTSYSRKLASLYESGGIPINKKLGDAQTLHIAMALLTEIMKCDMHYDENGHAYLKVPSRSLFDLGAQISNFLNYKSNYP